MHPSSEPLRSSPSEHVALDLHISSSLASFPYRFNFPSSAAPTISRDTHSTHSPRDTFDNSVTSTAHIANRTVNTMQHTPAGRSHGRHWHFGHALHTRSSRYIRRRQNLNDRHRHTSRLRREPFEENLCGACDARGNYTGRWYVLASHLQRLFPSQTLPPSSFTSLVPDLLAFPLNPLPAPMPPQS